MTRKTCIAIFSLFLILGLCFADEPQKKPLMTGKVNAENINIRSDSTASAEVICQVLKDQYLDIILERYDWYKVKLPADADVFIKSDFVKIGEDNVARVTKNNVNIRARPDISAQILGKVSKGEVLKIKETKDGWHKIEPVNCFGWIHKNFLDEIKEAHLAKEVPDEITAIGILKAKTFTRIASYKLITDDNRVYLVRGATAQLAPFIQQRVKIIGKLVNPAEFKSPPIIEIEKIEATN